MLRTIVSKMKRIEIILLIVFCVLALVKDAEAEIGLDDAFDRQMVMTNLSSMPLAFTENQGQFGDKTLFKANAGVTCPP